MEVLRTEICMLRIMEYGVWSGVWAKFWKSVGNLMEMMKE